ncbi:hypothetical protein CXF80_11930 [Shewanella sp. Actino-trap-3]|uniref:DUF805 domain-containing protein n=1 Tax=Shewanella sp. Actino-trap-3 TaxID=2058331 RepID=UPI000C3391FA|nr:DUF805 domain-containing protein [Shewanella sp. Actino-trap-3]PKG78958.1 hypothetical protein CXF80_11930 [Shewanella sp. Actino-trap-3]
MFVKPLLCRDGRDTGLRLMIIILAAFLLLTVAAIVFPASVINWVVTLTIMPIVGLSAVRRLNDVNKSIKLAMVCVVPVGLFGILTYFMAPLGALAGVFLFGLACGGYLAFMPAKSKINYVQGYNGPSMVPVSFAGSVHHRQEPVMKRRVMPVHTMPESTFSSTELTDDEVNFTGSVEPDSFETEKYQLNDDVVQQASSEQTDAHMDHDVDEKMEDDQVRSFSTSSARSNQPLYVDQDALHSGSITELAKSWLNVAKLHQQKLILIGKITAAIVAAGLVVYLVSALISVFSGEATEQTDHADEMINQQQASSRQMIKLPDGFWLVLDGDVLIVRWLGDRGDARRLWHLASAIGDKTCANLEFNDGSRYRPLTVDRLQDSATEARFTPLDKDAIVNNVALKGSFKLCGYEFSLKGSQATLMQNPQFEMILSQ